MSSNSTSSSSSSSSCREDTVILNQNITVDDGTENGRLISVKSEIDLIKKESISVVTSSLNSLKNNNDKYTKQGDGTQTLLSNTTFEIPEFPDASSNQEQSDSPDDRSDYSEFNPDGPENENHFFDMNEFPQPLAIETHRVIIASLFLPFTVAMDLDQEGNPIIDPSDNANVTNNQPFSQPVSPIGKYNGYADLEDIESPYSYRINSFKSHSTDNTSKDEKSTHTRHHKKHNKSHHHKEKKHHSPSVHNSSDTNEEVDERLVLEGLGNESNIRNSPLSSLDPRVTAESFKSTPITQTFGASSPTHSTRRFDLERSIFQKQDPLNRFLERNEPFTDEPYESADLSGSEDTQSISLDVSHIPAVQKERSPTRQTINISYKNSHSRHASIGNRRPPPADFNRTTKNKGSSKLFTDEESMEMFHTEPLGWGNIGLINSVISVRSLMKERLWVGTIGLSTDDWSLSTKEKVSNKLLEERHCIPVYTTDEEIDGHYHQFCKQVLWKPFHYQIQDYPQGLSFQAESWKMYYIVNRKFADQIIENYKEGDIVWVNDYHLMLVPEMIREKLPNAIIGFFLHIPFPSTEIFRCLHVRNEILEGLLGADLIGFQTDAFMRQFLMACTRVLGLPADNRSVQLEERLVYTGITPIGINVESLKSRKDHPYIDDIVKSLRETYKDKVILLGRDKNDYVKGVRQKMLGYERFLQDHPEWCGKVVLLQVALSTTEANESKSQVIDVVSRINSCFGSINYSPVVYLQQDISYNYYIGLLRAADACIITSLRDGMNLTSHEFIVCQEGHYGPLIISEFAGTCSNFGAALRINPWDTREEAETIYQALMMPMEERKKRWEELMYFVKLNNAQHYVQKFIEEVACVHEEMKQTQSNSIPYIDVEDCLIKYARSHKRIFFLDQDGTILNFNKHSSTQLISQRISVDVVVNIVKNIAADERNLVYVVSGRCKSEMEDFKGIPNVGLGAENGCFLKYADTDIWESMVGDDDLSWRESVLEIFEYYTDRTPGSYIEQKEIAVVWHYGYADMNFGSWQAAELQHHIEQALGSTYDIQLLAKKRSLEVTLKKSNKGVLIRKILEYHQRGGVNGLLNQNKYIEDTEEVSETNSKLDEARILLSQPVPITKGSLAKLSNVPLNTKQKKIDFIFCIGNDRADEFMFEYLRRVESRWYRKELIRRTTESKKNKNDYFAYGGSLTSGLPSSPLYSDPYSPIISPWSSPPSHASPPNAKFISIGNIGPSRGAISASLASGFTGTSASNAGSVLAQSLHSNATLNNTAPFDADELMEYEVNNSSSNFQLNSIFIDGNMRSEPINIRNGLESEELPAFSGSSVRLRLDNLKGTHDGASIDANNHESLGMNAISEQSLAISQSSGNEITDGGVIQNNKVIKSRRTVITITVGKKSSAAKSYIRDPQDVLHLLKEFVHISENKAHRKRLAALYHRRAH